MGGSISPSLANIFLWHHEENWINNCSPELKPLFYRRYVDDTFVLFNNPLNTSANNFAELYMFKKNKDSEFLIHNPLQIQPFLQYLNNQHSRMEFTLESERNNSIAFLDVNVVKHYELFTTNLYQKPTFTGLDGNIDKRRWSLTRCFLKILKFFPFVGPHYHGYCV